MNGMVKGMPIDGALALWKATRSYDKLAAELADRWRPEPPDKRRSARSLAAEIRKLSRGNATWFQRRPKAAKLLARILNSTPVKLGLVLYVVQSLVRNAKPKATWQTRAAFTTLEEAEDQAWKLLTLHGGDWRVIHGGQAVAHGAGYLHGPYSHDRSAIWSRASEAKPKKRRRSS